MTQGVFFAVVGDSGAGKDTVLAGAAKSLASSSEFRFARRHITRPCDAGGENHLAVSEAEFQRTKDNDGFCLSWSAHGLHYGLSRDLVDDLAAGMNVVCNVSRTSLGDAAALFDRLEVIEIAADPGTIAERLTSRGREDAVQVATRQARQVANWRNGYSVHTIRNDGPARDAIAAMTGLLLNLSGENAQSA